MAFQSEGSKTVEKEHYCRRHHSEWETSGRAPSQQLIIRVSNSNPRKVLFDE